MWINGREVKVPKGAPKKRKGPRARRHGIALTGTPKEAALWLRPR